MMCIYAAPLTLFSESWGKVFLGQGALFCENDNEQGNKSKPPHLPLIFITKHTAAAAAAVGSPRVCMWRDDYDDDDSSTVMQRKDDLRMEASRAGCVDGYITTRHGVVLPPPPPPPPL